jgi:hypothetical protein
VSNDVPEQTRPALTRSIVGRANRIAGLAELVRELRRRPNDREIKTLDDIDCDLERVRVQLEYLLEKRQ